MKYKRIVNLTRTPVLRYPHKDGGYMTIVLQVAHTINVSFPSDKPSAKEIEIAVDSALAKLRDYTIKHIYKARLIEKN